MSIINFQKDNDSFKLFYSIKQFSIERMTRKKSETDFFASDGKQRKITS